MSFRVRNPSKNASTKCNPKIELICSIPYKHIMYFQGKNHIKQSHFSPQSVEAFGEPSGLIKLAISNPKPTG